MTRLLIALLAVILVGCTPGCETSKPDRTDADAPEREAADLQEERLAELRKSAEAARDREFEQVPDFRAVSTVDDLDEADKSPRQVRRERDLLVGQLFGGDADKELDPMPAPFDDLARFDRRDNRITYVDRATDRARLETAVVARLVEALDAQHFDRLPEATSWDHELALEAARHATVSVALADYQRGRADHRIDLSKLTARPEVAQRLPVLGELLEAPEQGDTRTRADRFSTFSIREGWALGAALYRSSGWSAVELAHLEAPERTADVVRPDHWMEGEPVGSWKWPKGDEADREGLVGPGLMTLWLEPMVGPALARTVYAGYTSDAYRYYEGDENTPERFEWLTLWDSTQSAEQIVQAFEMRLRKRFEDADHPDRHFVVFRKGLNVGVIIAEMDEKERRKRARRLLEKHRTQLEPRDGLPASFVETRQDELNRKLGEATLDDRVWSDPSTNLRLDLNPLGEEWKVRQPDQGPVRWFAQHDDGAMAQLTVELDDPLGPDFHSEAYRDDLVRSFEGSLGDAEVDDVSATRATPQKGWMIHLAGMMNNQPRELRMWQFPLGDLIISVSLQAPAESFEEHRRLDRKLVESLEPLESERDGDDRDSEDGDGDDKSGIIEYEVEDEPSDE